MISYIIPTYRREEILLWHLDELNYQTLGDFEVIVVNDGGESISLRQDDYSFDLTYVEQENAGPAAARNYGAELASRDILLFVGDDCLPDRQLAFRHVYNHLRDEQEKAVQGYTIWHGDVAGSEFQEYLLASGTQANWAALREESGGWKYNISPSFCLTTNYSIHRRLYERMGGMDERLKEAAWDDIDFGYRAQREGIRAVFDPGAVNYHHHRYTIEKFTERQKKEGYWRVRLCLNHPELTASLIPVEEVRQADEKDLNELIRWAKELDHIYGDEEITQKRYGRWQKALQTASLKGIGRGLEEYGSLALRAVKYMPDTEAATQAIGGVAGLERGDEAYALHCIGWLHKRFFSAHSHIYAGEIYLEVGDTRNARMHFEKALEFDPNDWALKRLEELNGQS